MRRVGMNGSATVHLREAILRNITELIKRTWPNGLSHNLIFEKYAHRIRSMSKFRTLSSRRP